MLKNNENLLEKIESSAADNGIIDSLPTARKNEFPMYSE